MTVTDQELSLLSSQYRLYMLQEPRVFPDETMLELLFGEATVTVRFATVSQRVEAQIELKRLLQVALDNRLIEEAEEALADFEEKKAIH